MKILKNILSRLKKKITLKKPNKTWNSSKLTKAQQLAYYNIIGENERLLWNRIEWEDCPRCNSNVILVKSCTIKRIKCGKEVICPKCGLKGEIEIDSGEAFVDWEDH